MQFGRQRQKLPVSQTPHVVVGERKSTICGNDCCDKVVLNASARSPSIMGFDLKYDFYLTKKQ